MMLEVNHNDMALDSRQIKKNSATFTRVLAGTFAAITLWSGSAFGPLRVNASNKGTESYSSSQNIEIIDESKVIDIPECYKSTVAYACGKEPGELITIRDLSNMDTSYLVIKIYDNSSLEWLNYIKGVEFLILYLYTDNTSMLRDIKKLNDVTSLNIISNEYFEINGDDFNFLTTSKQIESLSLTDSVSVPGFIESLTHLKKLTLQNNTGNYILDFKKMTFLDKLSFLSAAPYDIAIYLTSEEYQALKNSGVDIDFDNEASKKIFEYANRKLDNIVAKLSVTKNSSDIEKLDAILVYVLENLTYDSDVSKMLTEGTTNVELINSFYEGGSLYGALEKNTAICGNYTALVNALCERLGLSSYYLYSSNHAWSLVEVEGNLYYIDSTWLDGQSVFISNGEEVTWDEFGNKIVSISYNSVSAAEILKNDSDKNQLEWYMADPNSYPKSVDKPESHVVENLPKFYKLTPQEEINDSSDISSENKPIKLDDKKIGIKINGKILIVSGAVAVGLFAAIGGAIAIKNKKRRLRNIKMYNDFDMNYDSSDSYSGYGRW